MAELAPVALHAMKVASENYDNIANTGKKGMEQIRRRRNKRNGDQEEYYYSRNTTSNTRAKSAGDYYDRDTRGRDSGRSRRGTSPAPLLTARSVSFDSIPAHLDPPPLPDL